MILSRIKFLEDGILRAAEELAYIAGRKDLTPGKVVGVAQRLQDLHKAETLAEHSEAFLELQSLISEGYLYRAHTQEAAKLKPLGLSMGCGSKEPCSICEGKEPDFVPGKEPGEVVMKARRLIDAMDNPDPVTAMLDIATERAKERENEDRDRAGEQADHKEPLSESLPGGRGQVGGQGRDGEDQGEVSYVAPEDADEGAITQLGREVSDSDGAGDRRFGSAVIDGEINPIPVAGVGGLMLKAVGPPKKSPGYPPRTDLPEIAVPPFEGGRTGGEYIEPELAKPAESVRPVTRKLIQKMVLEGTFDLIGSEFYEGQLVELQPVEGGPKFIVTAKELARLQQEIHNKFVEGLRKAPGIEVEECKVSYSPSIPVCEKCGRHMDYLGNHDFICWKCSRTE